MGGEGSGRRPDPVKRLVGFNQPAPTDNGSIYIPNYSGIKEEAKKTSSVDITASGGGVGDNLGNHIATQTISGADIYITGAINGETISSISGATVTNATDISTNTTDISTISGAHYNLSDSFDNLSGAHYTHTADSSDPHGATLTQTNIISSGTISGATIKTTSDKTVSGADYVANILFGTTSGAHTASNYTKGTLMFIYN